MATFFSLRRVRDGRAAIETSGRDRHLRICPPSVFPRETRTPMRAVVSMTRRTCLRSRSTIISVCDPARQDRSTLADGVGSASYLLSPLVDQLRKHVLAASKLHADDTPVPVLAPGTGRTRTARLWTYVRDDRPAGSDVPPAVWFTYSQDRKGEPRNISSVHLKIDGHLTTPLSRRP